MSWADRAAPIVAEVLRNVGRQDMRELRKALIEAYPWGERANAPYKAWCSEIRRQLGHPLNVPKTDPANTQTAGTSKPRPKNRGQVSRRTLIFASAKTPKDVPRMTKSPVDPVQQLEDALKKCKPEGFYRNAAKTWLTIHLVCGPIIFAAVGSFLGFTWGKWAVAGGLISALVVAFRKRSVLAKADQRDWHETRVRESTANRKRTIEQALLHQGK